MIFLEFLLFLNHSRKFDFFAEKIFKNLNFEFLRQLSGPGLGKYDFLSNYRKKFSVLDFNPTRQQNASR